MDYRNTSTKKIISSFLSSSLSSSISSVSSSITSNYATQNSESASTSEISAGTASTPTPEDETEKNREKIESDLKNWQDKFSKAADKGAEDLDERVKDITNHQIERQVHGVGRSLVIQLEESSASETKKLKEAIREIIRSIPHEKSNDDVERAENELAKATRGAGLAVKVKAQALRFWRKGFEEETLSLVQAASKSTLEVIDNIRDLGLQEIGMRWAWMEGVTYKDWSNYHLLKKTFDKSRNQVEEVARDHDGLRKTSEAAAEVENQGMLVAEEAAVELGRLKEVGKWKIHAGDLSDDFSTRYVPAAVAAAGSNIVDKISAAGEKIAGQSRDSLNSVLDDVFNDGNEGDRISAAKDKINQIVAGASEAIIGTPVPAYESIASIASESLENAASAVSKIMLKSSTPLTESASSAMSSISSSASSAASVASKKIFAGAMAQKVEKQEPIFDDEIVDDSEEAYSEKFKSIVDEGGDRFADVTKAVSDALLRHKTEQGSVQSLSAVADEQYSRAIAAASSVLYGTQQGTAESITSLAGRKYAEAVAA